MADDDQAGKPGGKGAVKIEMGSGQSHILLREDTDPATFQEAVWGRVFNRRRDLSRLPSAVVRASSIASVKQAVAIAHAMGPGTRVSVRSGGHSWAAWSVRQDAVLVDLAALRRMVYDEVSGVVACSPGITGEELNVFLAEKGKMFAGGHCPDVGLGGFLLQGGMGWNCKNWGWACESIVGVDVVTADGRELHCSEVENVDLFWAARGAGPGFPAIVTEFQLMTRPLVSMFSSAYLFRAQECRTALRWVIDVAPTADADTEVVCVAKRSEKTQDVEVIAGFLTFKPNKQQAQEAMRAAHDGRPVSAKILAFCEETNFANEYLRQREEQPMGYRFYSDNVYVANDADVPEVLEEAFTSLPSQKSFALYFAMNPTSRRPLPNMAHSLHSDHYFSMYSIWVDEDGPDGAGAQESRCLAWVRDTMTHVERHSVGSYLGDADFRHRTTRFWGQEQGDRLRAIRQAWDPDGRICGYLDADDSTGIQGLTNEFGWTS
ncbi:FAD-binding domain-containing protein [Poronia punctata]|nr:FAD-binding domain-containing protein [Poronia punctata]